MNQIIQKKVFHNDGTFIGTFKITKELKNEAFPEEFEFNLDDETTLKNIPIVDSPSDKNPIEYCENPLNDFANIMILEATDYNVQFVFNEEIKQDSKIKDDDIFYTFKNGNFSIPPYNNFLNDSHIFGGFLNFKSYVGKTFIDIKYNEELIQIPIEVRSRKIDYYKEYPAMIADLSQYASGILFERNSPAYQFFEFADKCKNTFYEDFMYLEYLFLDENLPSTFEYLSKNLYSQLEENQEEVPLSLASNVGTNELLDMITNPENLYKLNNDSPLLKDSIWQKTDGWVPIQIEEKRYRDNVDTMENRFYKNFIESIDYLISNLLENVEEGYVKDKLLDYRTKTNYYLSQDYFKEIEMMSYAPLNSQILQKREGYRNILEYFLMLEFNFRMKWDEVSEDIRGFEKRLSNLYEIWCYFELLKIIENLTDHKVNLEDVFNVNKENWTISLKQENESIQKFNYELDGKEFQIELMYNKIFSDNPIYKSYSVELHPDYTLKIKLDEETYFLHFDAKYKFYLKNFTDNKIAKNEDIDKMHTYIDAIIHSIGAFVLFPGNSEVIYKQNKDSSIHSVGAFPLKPGDSVINENSITCFIKSLLSDL